MAAPVTSLSHGGSCLESPATDSLSGSPSKASLSPGRSFVQLLQDHVVGPERDRKGHNQRQQGSYCQGSPPCSNDAWNVSQEPESLTSLREDEQMKQHWEQCGSRQAFDQVKAQRVVILFILL